MSYKGRVAIASLAFMALSINLSVSTNAANAKEDTTIRPGKGVGPAKLGMTPERIKKAIGNSDGTYTLPNGITVNYSQWQEPAKTSTIREFYDNSDHMVQISVSATPNCATANGISINSSLAQVESKFKHLQHTQYQSQSHRIDYYDDTKHGIAFAFIRPDLNGASTLDSTLESIVVHQSGRPFIADKHENSLKP